MNKGYIKVRCVETFNSGISVDEEFSVTTDVVSNSEVPELNVDDNIRVVFNGEIMESYPIQLGTIYAIYLLDEKINEKLQEMEKDGYQIKTMSFWGTDKAVLIFKKVLYWTDCLVTKRSCASDTPITAALLELSVLACFKSATNSLFTSIVVPSF